MTLNVHSPILMEKNGQEYLYTFQIYVLQYYYMWEGVSNVLVDYAVGIRRIPF